MKLLSVILMILLATPAWAFPPLIAGKSAGGAAACSAYSASCSGSCLYSEDWEGATDCGDESHTNCRYTYTDTPGADGTINYDEANTTVQCSSCATKSLLISTTAATAKTAVAFAGTNTTTYAKGYFKVVSSPTLSSGGYAAVVTVQDSGGTTNYGVLVKRAAAGTGAADVYSFRHRNNANSIVYWDTATAVDGNWHQWKAKYVANCSSSCDNTKVVFYLDGVEASPAGSDYTTRNVSANNIEYSTANAASSFASDNTQIRSDTYPTCTGE